MSPGPQAGLEVERFIGSCLISAHGGHHVKGKNSPRPYLFGPREHGSHVPTTAACGYHGHGPVQVPPWTGAPLFCVASAHNRKARKGPARFQQKAATPDLVDDGRSPLSRLAIHTQGAPLIQAGRYGRHNFARNAPPPFRLLRSGSSNEDASRRADSPKTPPTKEPGASDSVSVASDESSTNSENSLPRIIKPRKRRKKDRKPPPPQQQTQVGEVVKQEEVKHHVQPTNDERLAIVPGNEQTVSEPDAVVKVKEVVVDTSIVEAKPTSMTKIVYNDDDLPAGLEQEDNGPATSCQCSYCDPVGVIWDAEQRCYSPFLTPPAPEPPASAFLLDGLQLRRSWSEPSPTTLHPAHPGQATRARIRADSEPAHHQSLEVSSQIITSPNGHRDIEIKFYSARAPRTFLAEE